MFVAAVALSACGNTISGVGKDISDVGAKVTKWQQAKDEKQPIRKE